MSKRINDPFDAIIDELAYRVVQALKEEPRIYVDPDFVYKVNDFLQDNLQLLLK